VKLPLARIAQILDATGEFDGDAVAQGYSLDSRAIKPGELFFAVKGERLDGHDFVEAALANGAVAAVVQREWVEKFAEPTLAGPASQSGGTRGTRQSLIVVKDALAALQKLAACVRREWGKPLIAVTGSAGKTTTKELIATLLATKYRVLKTEGNFNNHFGLPLQLLRLEPEHDIAVIELGMSHPGEITELAGIAQPEYGVVTNVAPVHLGFFQSVAGIARAKQELVDALPATGTAILNADDEYVSKFGLHYEGKIVIYGITAPADVKAEKVEQRGQEGSTFEAVAGCTRQRVHLPLIGRHNVYNALAAIAVGLQRSVSLAEAAEAIAKISAVDKRGQIVEIGGATVVNDCYNSNPRALDFMVDALAGMKPGLGGRRIVVAGEMLELGPAGEDLHRRCGVHAAGRGLDVVLGVRGLARFIAEAARSNGTQSEFVETPEQAGEWLAREVKAGDVVLLKASRGVKLERALETWKAKTQVL
jgi:UDP-N-acetylmuramoyl-tripeptide--D-alanyl-D-alanine ligase